MDDLDLSLDRMGRDEVARLVRGLGDEADVAAVGAGRGGARFEDAIGITGRTFSQGNHLQVPYRTLMPEEIDGLVVWAKRLERGSFQRPLDPARGLTIEIDATTLSMILGGADLKTGQRRKRYQRAS